MNKKADTAVADTRETRRRRLLQLLAVGGVFAGGKLVPETWVKPVIDEVVLPAHAQMSPPEDEDEPDTILPDDDTNIDDDDTNIDDDD